MVENKKNYCDKDGQCQAQCKEEMMACRYFVPEQTARPGLCVYLRALTCDCLSPDALTAKWRELEATDPAEALAVIQKVIGKVN